MKVTGILLAIAGIVLGGRAAQVQASEKGADRVRADLERQEYRAASRSLLVARNQQEVSAAADFARKIAGADDSKYLQVFQSSLNLAVALGDRARGGRATLRAFSLPAAALSPQSIYTDAVFIRNAKKLIGEGVAGVRVVGGGETTDFPDCVAVGSAEQWCCTGTLVAPNLVITAGHCYGGCGSRIFIGPSVEGAGETVAVAEAIRHPGYGTGNHNDLTVLILERDISTVSPRRIAPSDAIDSATSVRVVGYGNNDVWSSTGYGIRRMVDVPVATTSCASAEAQDRYGCDLDLELVAGAPFLDVDSCNGDSGGPIYVQHGGAWYVAGATSRATNEALRPCGDGGIYVRLDRFQDWIRSVPGGHWK